MNEVIVVGCYPNNQLKINILNSFLDKIRKEVNFPIVVVSHYPITEKVFDKIDYFIFDKHNETSSGNTLYYWYEAPRFIKIVANMRKPNHGVACLSSIMNAVLFCKDKFDIIHYFESDVDIDKFDEHLKTARFYLNSYKFYGFKYETTDGKSSKFDGIVTNLFSFHSKWYYEHIPDIRFYHEYQRLLGESVILEIWMYRILESKGLLSDCYIGDIPECVRSLNLVSLFDSLAGLCVRVFCSEISDGENVIIFVINDSSENIFVKINNLYGICPTKRLVYLIIPKSEKEANVFINNVHVRRYDFSVDNLSECMFRFYDDRFICSTWNHDYDEGFLKNEDNL